MPSEPRELEQRVDALSRQLVELQARVDKLEEPHGNADESPAVAAPAIDAIPSGQTLAMESSSRTLAFLGRTLVVLGGAYLLRATSDAQVIPLSAGVAAGFVYAIGWLYACHRRARHDRVSATFHGVAAVIIGFPLVFESTARFGVTTVPIGSAALLALGAGVLAVAARHRLVFLGWTATALYLGTALALVVATRDVLPVMCILLAAAAGFEVFAINPPWRSLRWPAALGVDLVAVLIWSLLVRKGGPPPNYAPLSVDAAVTLELLLPILYLTSIAARTLAFRRAVTAFGIAQCILALLIGLGGAAGILAATGGSVTPISSVMLILGAGCYAVSFAWLDRHSGRGRNFYFYSALGLLLILTGTSTLLSGDALATAYLVLALAGSWVGRSLSRNTLTVHATAYWVAGALASGILVGAWRGLLGDATASWPFPSPVTLFALAVGLVCYERMLPKSGTPTPSWSDLTHRLVVITLVAWSAAGLAAAFLGAFLAGAGGDTADAGLVATLRTGVLAVGAVALAAARRRFGLREIGWLIYPVLLAGGLKLVLEDLAHGRPATLFGSLALFGGALLAISKLSPPGPEAHSQG